MLSSITMTAKKEYAANFSEQQKEFHLRLHYNGVNCYLFFNGVEIYKSKAKDSKIHAASLELKKNSADIMKMTGSHGYVYDFSVDYDSIYIGNTSDMHKYLMVKNNMK